MTEQTEQPKKTIATWWISLDADCPHCKENVDLLQAADFWDGRGDWKVCEHRTPRTTDVKVLCPVCDKDFIVDLEY